MKSVTAREANEAFSRVLGEAESGEEIVITRYGKPVAVLRAYRLSLPTPERQAAVEHAIRLMEQAPHLGMARQFSRDEMHER